MIDYVAIFKQREQMEGEGKVVSWAQHILYKAIFEDGLGRFAEEDDEESAD